VLLFPALVLWKNDNALYSPPFYADAWFYLGYFKDLLEFKRTFFYTFYYGSRLSWILPGTLVHSLFPPLAANAMLHLAVESVAALSLFFTLRLTAGLRCAFLGTMMFAANPWLWTAAGWDYVDGAGIAYTLLAIALLTEHAYAAKPRWWIALLAGMALAGMAYSHLFLSTLIPFVLLLYVGVTGLRRQAFAIKALTAGFLWIAVGFFAITLVFCGINFLLDGNFWFYAPSIAQARYMAKTFMYTKPIWFQDQLVPWLWPVVAGCGVAILSAPILIARRRESSNAAALIFSGVLLLVVAYMIFLQLRGSTVLGHYPYSSYLLPFVFLVFGTTLWPSTEQMSQRAFVIVSLCAALTFAVLWFDPGRRISPAAQAKEMIAVACFIAAALLLRRRAIGSLLAIAGFAGLTHIALAQTSYFDGNDLHGNRAQYRRIMEARAIIESSRHGRQVRFWYDKKEPNFYEYTGLNATYLAEFSRVGTDFPKDCNDPVPPDSLVIVLSRNKQAAELARPALSACWQQLGLMPVLESQRVLPAMAEPYAMAMFHLEPGAWPQHPSTELVSTVDLSRAELGDVNARLERTSEGLLVTTLPGFGAFAARLKLGLNASAGSGLEVHVRARVLQGKIGIGILDPTSRTFIVQQPMWAFAQPAEVILPLPSPPMTGDLIVTNQAINNFVSTAVIERIEVRRRP